MKNLIFILLVIFTFYSCASDEVGFKQISKKEVMESWAWKIFIFTDEGEYQSIELETNKFYNNSKEKAIFVDDIWKMNLKDDLFLKDDKVAFEEETDNAIFEQVKRKK